MVVTAVPLMLIKAHNLGNAVEGNLLANFEVSDVEAELFKRSTFERKFKAPRVFGALIVFVNRAKLLFVFLTLFVGVGEINQGHPKPQSFERPLACAQLLSGPPG